MSDKHMETTPTALPKSSSSSRNCTHLSVAQHHLWAHRHHDGGKGGREGRGGALNQGPLRLSGAWSGTGASARSRPLDEDVSEGRGGWTGHSSDAMSLRNRPALSSSAAEMIRSRREMMRNAQQNSWPIPSDHLSQTAGRSINKRHDIWKDRKDLPHLPTSGNSTEAATPGDQDKRPLAMNAVDCSDDDISSGDVIQGSSFDEDISSGAEGGRLGKGRGKGLGGGRGRGSGGDSAECGFLQRRESYLYRSNSDYTNLSTPPARFLSHHSSLNDSCMEEMAILTPFAQILNCLRNVWRNYLLITNIPVTSSRRVSSLKDKDTLLSPAANLSDDLYERVVLETLDELEWCLEQLEITQSESSVCNLATNKFKKMLSRELSHLAESSQSGNQISEYIFSTFLDDPLHRSTPSQFVKDAESSDQSTVTDDKSRDVTRLRMTGLRRLTTKASLLALQEVPKYGVEPVDRDALEEEMSRLGQWGIDVFRISDATNGRPLTAVTYTILKERGLLRSMRISPQTLLSFIVSAEDQYRKDVSYHNSIHAADVTQSSHVLLLLPAIRGILTDMETLAVLFAAAMHDVDHPGLTNQFLVNAGYDLSLLYNDVSVLENHHLAVAFRLLQQKGCDILEEFNTNQRRTFRRMVIEMVLATDMTKHMDHVAHLKTIVETRRIVSPVTASSSSFSGASASASQDISLENYNDRIQVLQGLLHCADLSNPTKPLELYRKWTDRITEEFFRQGDLERTNQLDLSPMCDRHHASVNETQVGFIDFVVHPLWETWAELVYPDCQDILETLERNRNWFQQRKDSASRVDIKGSPSSGPRETAHSQLQLGVDGEGGNGIKTIPPATVSLSSSSTTNTTAAIPSSFSSSVSTSERIGN